MSHNWYSIGAANLGFPSAGFGSPETRVQPAGCMVVLQPHRKKVVAASFGHESLFGRQVLDCSLSELFDEDTCRWIGTQCSQETHHQHFACHRIELGDECFELAAHREAGLWIIELLPQRYPPSQPERSKTELSFELNQIGMTGDQKAALHQTAESVRRLFGFDLVLIGYFDQQGYEQVVAASSTEERWAGLPDAVFKHRTEHRTPGPPAIRYLSDTRASPVPLLTSQPLPENFSTHFSFLHPDISSPAFCHLAPWCRSGVIAGLSMDNRPWGEIIGINEQDTRQVTVSESRMLHTVAMALERTLHSFQAIRYTEKMRLAQDFGDLLRQKNGHGSHTFDVLKAHARTLLALMESDGLQLRFKGRFYSIDEQFRIPESVIEGIRERTREGLFVHDCVNCLMNTSAKQVPPGVLYIALGEHEHDYLCLTRGAIKGHIKHVCENLPEAHSVPFDFWYEPIQGIARPFQRVHRDMAQLIRQTLTLASAMEAGHVEQLRPLSHSSLDALTGLPNRISFDIELKQSVQDLAETRSQLALLFIDLDNFKEVNDTLGHACGDKLLIEVSQTLQRCLSKQDYVARLSGDEFTAILRGNPSRSHIEQVCQRIVDQLEKPFEFPEGRFSIGCSIGVTLAPQDATTPATLTRNADLAMYHAKAAGKSGYHFYDTDMTRRIQRREKLEAQLARSLDQEQFIYYFQPIQDVDNGRIVGAEALLRWRKRSGRVQPARVFEDIAREHGLINRIDAQMIRSLAGNLEVLNRQFPGTYLTCNLSDKAFLDGHIEDVISDLAEQPDLMKRMVFELKESTLIEHSGRAASVLKLIEDCQGRIVIDNFGTDSGSLVCLSDYPISGVKIDKSFLDNLDLEKARLFVISIIATAQRLGIQVFAEGVETPQQADFLKAVGCHFHQGYLYGKPMPWEKVFNQFH